MPGARAMLDAEFYRKQCARLRMENEELFEEVMQLREQCGAYAKTCDLPEQRAIATLGITPGAAKMLCRLLDAAPKTIAPECLLSHIGSRGSLETIKVYICRARKAIERLGVADPIRSVRGHGYHITEADAQSIRILLAIGDSATTEKPEDSINDLHTFEVQTHAQEKKRAVG